MTVRAVVRDLSDTELVLAQGKENAERRSLSFIERAFFAKALIDHGFDRATAQAARAGWRWARCSGRMPEASPMQKWNPRSSQTPKASIRKKRARSKRVPQEIESED